MCHEAPLTRRDPTLTVNQRAPSKAVHGRFVVALAGGLLAGVALDVLTFVVARYGPSGGGDGTSWSGRGTRSTRESTVGSR
jgi:hypothetical protein